MDKASTLGKIHYLTIRSDGDKYEGEWFNNIKHGKGKMIYTNGTERKGIWKDD